ncbi:ketohexokinase-like protein [Leptotrombidium deliense]|uniref:Ketohexokinase-like protein n=1 Tax=Leptotrombidium deliense TaxID=299467 RepID=A0A443S978_9ACAR|nr:ketohexokinase-like protein [Leptotrombidium deliense]
METTDSTEMKRILFVGLCCLDIVNVCDEYPKEDSDQRWVRGGNAANNCTVFSKLRQWFMNENKYECPVFVEYFGTFGNDYSAEFLLNDFSKYKINVNKVDTKTETPCSSIIINKQNGSRTILHSNKIC